MILISKIMYDVIIIGAGPAGMAAAIYGVRREMKTLMIGREVGGQVTLASDIENYPGFESIPSFEFVQKIKQQALNFGAELKEADVKKIEKTDQDTFVVYTDKEKFESRTVVIAMGLSPRRLAVPGEIELNGRGISYCANCDGPFFKKKTVAVIGGGNSALDAAEIMSKIAEKVYLVHRREEFRGFEVLIDEVKARPNIEIVYNAAIKSIEGEQKVEKIKINDSKTNQEREIKLDGVFIEIGRIANTDLVADLVDRDKSDQIIVNAKCETKTPGLYAAGDVTTTEFKQITVAMGQATTAVLAAYQYIQLKDEKK